MIRTVLLSGFLGAGKTTLLQRLLDGRERTGVIINEFGDIHMDGALVRKEGIEGRLRKVSQERGGNVDEVSL